MPSKRAIVRKESVREEEVNEMARARRQITVWRLRMEGYSFEAIAQRLGITLYEVGKDIAAQRKLLEEVNAYTTVDALTEFLARNDDVVRMAKRRMKREEKMEDDYKKVVDKVLDIDDGQQGHISIPMPPRTSHAAYIAEIRKANEDFGRVTGIFQGNNPTINIALMGDFDLIKEAVSLGIDIEALGIKAPASTLQRARFQRAELVEQSAHGEDQGDSPSSTPDYQDASILEGEWEIPASPTTPVAPSEDN